MMTMVDKVLYKSVKKHIVSGLKDQIDFGMHTDVAFCLGNGLNYKFLNRLNEEFKFFEHIVPLPHPRWVMQYRRKRTEEFVAKYLNELNKV